MWIERNADVGHLFYKSGARTQFGGLSGADLKHPVQMICQDAVHPRTERPCFKYDAKAADYSNGADTYYVSQHAAVGANNAAMAAGLAHSNNVILHRQQAQIKVLTTKLDAIESKLERALARGSWFS